MSQYPPTQPGGAAPAGAYRCPWCGLTSTPTGGSCPACGSPVDVRLTSSRSGWYELPPIKDMARIQFGQSYCQIEGKFSPVADFNLARGDGIYFAHHVLLWKDPQVGITTMPLRGGWSRVFAGLPLIMTQAVGPGHAALSRDEPGETAALPVQPGQSVDVKEHVFIAATHNISYDWFNTDIWFQTRNGDDIDTLYPIGMFMDQFTAPASPGLLLLHGAGNVFERRLQPGETILIRPTSLLFKDSSVGMHLHIEHPGGTWRSWRSWGERYLWLRMVGPGRVGVQSNFPPMEDPGYNMVGASFYTTYQRW